MIAVAHYAEETLISLLEAGDETLIAADKHLAACGSCKTALDQYRSVVDVLGEEAAWDSQELTAEPNPQTLAHLRTFATEMEREDHEAESIVAALLTGARETWMPRLQQHPEWRRAGVVRKLAAASYPALDKMPPDAVEITRMATEIADHLDPAKHTSDMVIRLRGAAWRERAYALYYVGKFVEALEACDRSQACFGECAIGAEYDLARVGVIRALALRPFERFYEAIAETESASRVMSSYGDAERAASAAIATAQNRYKTGELPDALQLLLATDAAFSNLTEDTRARLFGNIAYCYRELGQSDAAVTRYRIAAEMFDRVGARTESTRVRWSLAGLLLTNGETDCALRELEVVRVEFDNLGMRSESTVASLEIAEALLVEQRFDRVEAVCREVAARFATSGLTMTSRAMTAVAYLEEAVRARRATPKLVRHVRDYVQRLPTQPELLFVPPLF